MKRSLRQETIFYGIAKYTNVFVTLVTSSILARLLTPEEFGVVSVVTVFTAFFAILSDMGLGTAVIQNKALTDDEINDIYSFSAYVSLGLGCFFVLLGLPIAVLYGDSIYIKICLLLSISVFFNAVNIIPNALLMKGKRFRLVGKRLIAVSVATGVIAVAMALAGFSYYAIVFQSIFQSVFIFVWNYWNTNLKFHLRINRVSIRKIQQYSTFQFSYSIINYFARNLDNLLIGKVLGSVSLAYYDKGYRLMMYPVQNLTYVINPILHPILSEYQNDKEYIYRSYMKVVRVLSLLGVYIAFICFCCSEEIIFLFFGHQWKESVSIFRLLSLSVWPQLVSASAGSIYQSSGNTRLMFKSGTIHFGITIVLIVIGILSRNLEVIALLVALSLFIRFFVDYYFLIVRNFEIKFTSFLYEFRFDIGIAAVFCISISILNQFTCSNLFISLAAKVCTLSIVYFVMLIITKQFRYIRIILRGKK